MPVIVPSNPTLPAVAQSIATVPVWDYFYAAGDPTKTLVPGLAGKKVKITLQYDLSTTISPDPQVVIGNTPVTVQTNPQGYWSANLVPNNRLAPANTTYMVEVEGYSSYLITVSDVAVPTGGWQSTAYGVLVNVPTPLAPATSALIGPLTVSGLLTAQAGIAITAGGLTVQGGITDVGGLTVDTLSYSSVVSRLVPGSTSFSVRNNANNADNLLVTDAGVVTARAGLNVTAGGITVTAGDLAVTAGNLTMAAAASRLVPGATSFSVRDTANANDNLLVSNAGNVTARGSLTVTAGPLTLSAGNLNVTVGSLVFAAASAKIIPGATSLLVRNNADSASNLTITDAGLLTTRNALEVAPSAGGALPTHTYGTVPNLLDSQTGTAVASLTLTIPAGVARSLWLEIEARSDQAATQAILVQFNGDTAGNYDSNGYQDLNATLTGLAPTVAGTSARMGLAVATGAAAGAESATSVRILNADSTTQRKMWKYDTNSWATDAAGSALYEAGQGQWRNVAAAIASIKLLPSAGSFSFIRARVYSGP